MDENFGGLIDMRKMKKALCAALCMSFIMAMPAYAAVTSTKTNTDGSIAVKTDNANMEYPCWIWRDGYCYYYENSATIAKNTTTRDGYTVDAEGRWTVNGVPQTNGYGSKVLGTAEYNGKSEDEIWSLMQGKIKNVFENSIPSKRGGDVLRASGYDPIIVHAYTYTMGKDEIAFDYSTDQYGPGESYVYCNDIRNGNFLTVAVGASWSDQTDTPATSYTKAFYANLPLMKEQLIKATVGDTVGQELFNYLRSHADQKNVSGGWKNIYDENGNPIKGWYETILDSNGNVTGRVFHEDPNFDEYKGEWTTEAVGDGFDASAIDWSAWQNRTTDYGKRFSVTADDRAMQINVYH